MKETANLKLKYPEELDATDNPYYLKDGFVKIDSAVGGKASTTHVHDDRYYTKAETDTLVTNIYISNSGSDTTGDGTEAKPYKTLDYVINMLKSTKYNGAHIMIYLTAGQIFTLSMPTTILLAHLNRLGINSTSRTKATVNISLSSASTRIQCDKVQWNDLQINVSTISGTGFTTVLSSYNVQIIRCIIESSTGARFMLCGDGLTQLMVNTYETQIKGNAVLISTPSSIGTLLLKLTTTTFASTASITTSIKTVDGLIKMGDWYTTGEIPYAPSGHGLGTKCVTITDWNNATTNGWYMGSGIPNAPSVEWYYGTVVTNTSAWIMQTVTAFTGSKRTFRRFCTNGVFGTWQPVEAYNIPCSNSAPTAYLGDGRQHQQY